MVLDRLKAKRGALRARAPKTIAMITQLASTEVHDVTDATRQQLVSSENSLTQIWTDITTMDGQVQDQLSLEEITTEVL